MQGCVDSLQGSFIRRYCSCIKHMSRYCRMCTPTYVKCRALLSGCRVLLTDHRARLSECSVLPSNMCLAIATHMCTPTKCRTLLSGYEVLLTDHRARLSGGIALLRVCVCVRERERERDRVFIRRYRSSVILVSRYRHTHLHTSAQISTRASAEMK